MFSEKRALPFEVAGLVCVSDLMRGFRIASAVVVCVARVRI